MATTSLRKRQRILLALSGTILFILFSLLNIMNPFYHDISHKQRYSLHPETLSLLELFEEPINISAFYNNQKDKKAISKALKALQSQDKKISVDYINLIENPKRAKDLGYEKDVRLLIKHDNKSVLSKSYQAASVHTALQKLLSNDKPIVAYSNGFGERQAFDDAPFNFSQFVTLASENQFTFVEVDLNQLASVPTNADILFIAGPSEEINIIATMKIIEFIKLGGSVLWLADTDSQTLPPMLSTTLGLNLLEGIVVDANSQKYIEGKPDFVPVIKYPADSMLSDMTKVTLFPQAKGFKFDTENALFTRTPILQSSESSWTETGMIRGNIAFDENTVETAGPITIGTSLVKTQQGKQDQRIIMLGDSDFIANAYINNADNANLGMRLLRWLSHQNVLLEIENIPAPDTTLQMSNRYFFTISILFIIVLPLLLLGRAIWVFVKNK